MTDLWTDLTQHAEAAKTRPIISLFDTDPQRFERFSATHDGLLLDFSSMTGTI